MVPPMHDSPGTRSLERTHAHSNAQLEEVIVTAERREQSLQDVPIAVTAFSSDRVASLRLEDLQDLNVQIPGFSVNSFSKTRINPALRGGSSSLASAGAEQAVGLFIDDVYFGGSGDFEIELFDVERIEVLRGPQGTLFGRNTTGGLINVVTRDPGEEREGKLQATIGNYGLNQMGAYLAAPITDTLSASLAISSRDREGTSFNSVTGNDVDDVNRSAIRGKLVWQPNDDLSIKLGITHNRASETGVARDAVSPQPTVDLDVLAAQDFRVDDDPRTVQMFEDGSYVSEQWVGSLHIEKYLDKLTLQSITTARDFVADQTPVSLTGVPVPSSLWATHAMSKHTPKNSAFCQTAMRNSHGRPARFSTRLTKPGTWSPSRAGMKASQVAPLPQFLAAPIRLWRTSRPSL